MSIFLFSSFAPRRKHPLQALPALSVLFLLISLLVASSPAAWAGHWVLTYTGTAVVATQTPNLNFSCTQTVTYTNSVVTSNVINGLSQVAGSFHFGFYGGNTYDGSYFELDNALPNTTNTLTIHGVMTWTPDSVYDNSEPPASISYEEITYARLGLLPGAENYPRTANDGFPDAPTFTSIPYSLTIPFVISELAQGSHYNTIAVPILRLKPLVVRARVVNLPERHLTASASINDWSPEEPGLFYAIATDRRGVEIYPVSGGGYLATQNKSAFTNTNGSLTTNGYGDVLYGRYPNQFNGYNSSTGDIGIDTTDAYQPNSATISYNARVFGATDDFPIKTDDTLLYFWFHNLSDGVDPDHLGPKGFTTLDPSIDVFQTNYNGKFNFSNPNPNAPPAPITTLGTDHVYFTYTPIALGAKYTSNFYMRVHQGQEWYLSKKNPDTAWRLVKSLKTDNPGTSGNNGTISATWDDDDPLSAPVTIEGKDIVAGTFTVLGASTPNPLLNGLLTLAGFTADKYGPVPDHGTADFDGCWSSPYSTFSSPIPSDYYQVGTTPQQQNVERDAYSMTPYMFMAYKRTYYTYDVYDLSGYKGQYFQALDTLIRTSTGAPASNAWCGAFQKITDIGKQTAPVPTRPEIDSSFKK